MSESRVITAAAAASQACITNSHSINKHVTRSQSDSGDSSVDRQKIEGACGKYTLTLCCWNFPGNTH